MITLDSALKKDDNYYPQVFLKEFKNKKTKKNIEKKAVKHINDNLSNFSSDDDDDDESDEEKISN